MQRHRQCPAGRTASNRLGPAGAANRRLACPARRRPQVKGYAGADQLGECLKGCELVIIPAGVPRKPGMTRDDLFNINAGIVKALVQAVAEHCPNVRRGRGQGGGGPAVGAT